jgi:hypothetical protein
MRGKTVITGAKLFIGIVTALLGFAATTSALNAPNDQPASTVPSTVYVPYSVPAPTTTVNVDSCTIVGTLLALEGLPVAEMETALKVAYRESRCTHDAFNATDTMGGSAGYFQVNYFWCKPSTYWPTGWLQAQGILDDCAQLFDPQINARAAVAIWRNSGWLPWKTAN